MAKSDMLHLFHTGYADSCPEADVVIEQTVVKTERAAAHLKWLSVRTLAPGEAARFRERVQQEEADYQTLLAEALDGML